MRVICDYCKKDAELVDSAVVYGKSYGMIWLCKPCDAYVGVHKNSKRNAPLGRLANRQLREWRVKVHDMLDPVWRMKLTTRKEAYKALAKLMNIPEEDCHIGKFNIKQCKKALFVLGDKNED